MSIPLIAVPRTMPLPCQKCWRNIICQRCSIRVGSSPTSSSARSSTAPDDGARVPLERRLAPAVEARLVGQDLDEDPVAHPGVADVRLDRGDLHVALLTRSSSATLSSISVVIPPRPTFVFVIPYAQR